MRIAFAALAAVAALAPSVAMACSCLRQTSAAQHLESFELAFVGRALGSRVGPDGQAVTRFQVMETLKGAATGAIAVSHHTVSATCGREYRPGVTVLVLAERGRDGALRTGLCAAPQFPEEDYRRAAAGH